MNNWSISDFRGIVPPIVTPVDSREKVDTSGLLRVIDYVLAGGVHGIFVNGSNGEFYAFDEREQARALDAAVTRVDGRVPVYAGASAITTREAVTLARSAESVGADALTVLTPMFVQPDENELFEHFLKISEAVQLPVLIYNNPGRTTNSISPALLKRLVKIENVIGIKNTSLDFSLTMKYLEVARLVEHFNVFGGIDYYVYATLSHGGLGSVAGTANVAPALVVEIYDRFVTGDFEGALDAQRRLIPLRDAYAWGSFPVMMKVCLNILGLDVGLPVAPVQYVGEETIDRAREMLKGIGLLED